VSSLSPSKGNLSSTWCFQASTSADCCHDLGALPQRGANTILVTLEQHCFCDHLNCGRAVVYQIWNVANYLVTILFIDWYLGWMLLRIGRLYQSRPSSPLHLLQECRWGWNKWFSGALYKLAGNIGLRTFTQFFRIAYVWCPLVVCNIW
jgi:hypothetical protein